MRTVLALLAAAGLVVGALWVRTNVLDGDAPGADVAGPVDPAVTERGGAAAADVLRVRCAEVAASVCEGLSAVAGPDVEVRVEAAATTAARLVPLAGAPDLDVWVTGAAWPAIVDDGRQRGGRGAIFADRIGAPVARTPLVLAAWEERAEVLEAHCGGDVTWRCVGEATAQPWSALGGETAWGGVELGMADPGTTATGLAVLGQAAAGFFDSATFASNDFRGDFTTWLRDLADAASVNGDPYVQMLRLGRAQDLTATTEAAVLQRSDAARDVPRLLYAPPVATLDVVVASTGADVPPEVAEALAEAFRAGSWHVGGAAPAASGTGTLPETDGLPSPGVLEALRQEWEGVAG